MIEWKKYEPFNDKSEQPQKHQRYLVYSSIGAEVAYFSTWSDWKINNNDVWGVTHFAEINNPES